MMKRYFAVILTLSLAVTICSQQLTGDIEIYLRGIVDVMPGSNGNNYHEPTQNELAKWGIGLQTFLNGNIELARQRLDELNYEIIEFRDTTEESGEKYYIFREKTAQVHYWGTYSITGHPRRKELIIQCPHTIFDTNTGYQGIYCFKRLSAGALFLNGAHRCNNTSFSPCSGTTTVCDGTNSPYRISDNAHNVNSIFQKCTELLFLNIEGSVFVQFHGFAKLANDPYVIMSNGTRITPDADYVTLIRTQLTVADPVLTFKVAHVDLNWTRLIATTNTQGRYINGSSDPCSQNATGSNGRFVHIEQEKSRLRENAAAWDKMLFALSNVFEEDTITGVETATGNGSLEVFPNPTAGILHFRTDRSFSVSLYNLNGQFMARFDNISSGMTIDLSKYNHGIYYLIAESPNVVLYRKIILLN